MSSKADETKNSKEDEDNSESISETITDQNTNTTYIRGKFLGKGAHARVHVVTDVSNPGNVSYAMKIMKLELSKGDNEPRFSISKSRSREVRLSQVLKEVQIHNMMNHVNIVKLVKWFQADSRFYMLLEHCQMNNLAQLLRTEGTLPEKDTRGLVKQLVCGLQHIHNHGIIHRDLKPGNIYLTSDMVLKIGDFGLADRINSGRKGICGTPNYISPEVLNEEGYTPAVDVWAVGCITYHMLSGRPPFEAESQTATYDLIKRHHYPPLLTSKVSVPARHLINWTLEFRPERRPNVSFILDHPWIKKEYRSNTKRYHKEHRKTVNRSKKMQYAENVSPATNKVEGNALGSVDSEHNTESTLQEEKGCLLLKGNPKEDKTEGKDFGKEREEAVPFWRSLVDKLQSQSFGSLESLSKKNRLVKIKDKMTNIFKKKHREPFRKAIEAAVKKVPTADSDLSSPVVVSSSSTNIPNFVVKWIDYSNQYGFGYVLNNGTAGVLFNDSCQICLDSSKTCVTTANDTQRMVYPIHSTPNDVKNKLQLLEYFVDYMDENLSSGVDENVLAKSTLPSPLVKQWSRNTKIILIELTNNALQINFLHDHFKFIFYKEDKSDIKIKYDEESISMLVVDDTRKIKKFNLNKLSQDGCPEYLIHHLLYIHSIL